MTFNRATTLALLIAACSMQASAQTALTPPAKDGLNPGSGQVLVPRQPLPKKSHVVRGHPEAKLIVKFRDQVQARAQADKSVSFTAAGVDAAAADAVTLSRLTAQYSLQFESTAANIPQSTIDRVIEKAQTRSGKAQPDLQGIMFVNGPDSTLVAAANELLTMESVEYAFFQTPWQPFPIEGDLPATPVNPPQLPKAPTPALGAPSGLPTQFASGPVTGACCIADSVCIVTDAAGCTTMDGLYQGDGTTCTPNPCPIACCLYVGAEFCVLLSATDCAAAGGVNRGGDTCTGETCDFECGTEDAPSCFVAHSIPACYEFDEGACCEIVGAIRPFCIEVEPSNEPGPGTWDELCVAIAHMWCDTPPADRCLAGSLAHTEGCFQAHDHQGCNDTVCCYAVCAIEPYCCTAIWDGNCASLALELCTAPPAGVPTPNLIAYQGYLRQSAYEDQLGGYPPPPMPPQGTIPIGLPGYFAPPRGLEGEGYALFGEGGPPARLSDDPGMPLPDRYGGIYGLGRQLLEVYGIGSINQARGAGVKVAVIEWSCYQFHEDLNIIVEPGQTLLTMFEDLNNHATACLGIINAKNDGKGVTGIAPDATSYFFPLTSVEEGPRLMAAFINCYDTLDPGDVVSCSFGPPPINLNGDPFAWTLMRVGSDMGIITCVAAGNSCHNMDDEDDLGDSGAIVVGAGTPGSPYCRLTFSNYFRTAGPLTSNRVHCQAWGIRVATLGYGDLFVGDDNPNRAYTVGFNGTSAACPQVAGMLACCQGLAKQFYGIPLSPTQLRGAMSGTRQCNMDPGDLPGFSADVDCGPDTDPDSEGNLIGIYANPASTAQTILTQSSVGFGQSPQLTDVYILRGNLAFGNIFSIKSSDNSYLTVQSLYTKRNHVVNLNSPSQEANTVASRVRYLSTGYTTDIMVRAKAPQNTSQSTSIQITGEIMNPDLVGMVFYEMYDWRAARWIFVALDVLPQTGPGGEEAIVHDVADGRRFIEATTRSAYVRAYVLSSGPPQPNGPGGHLPPGSTFRFDWINVTFGGGGTGLP